MELQEFLASPPTSSSAYASMIVTSMLLSTPADVSITHGINFSLSPDRDKEGSCRMLLVSLEVEIGAIVDSLDLVPSEREVVLDIDSRRA